MKSSLIRINLIFLLFVLFIPRLTSAEIKTFVREYTYQASEIDSKMSCRVIALEHVKRLLLEELGTYLESRTEVKDFRLTKDRIVILTAGIVRTEIVSESWDGNSLKYQLKAKLTADPGAVIKSVDSLRKDAQKTRELEELRKKADDALREIEQLKKEMRLAKSDKDDSNQKSDTKEVKDKVIFFPLVDADKNRTAKYDKTINELSAYDWFEKAMSFLGEQKYNDSIDAFNKAIELNPKGRYILL